VCVAAVALSAMGRTDRTEHNRLDKNIKISISLRREAGDLDLFLL
jgi:hypothetical protein